MRNKHPDLSLLRTVEINFVTLAKHPSLQSRKKLAVVGWQCIIKFQQWPSQGVRMPPILEIKNTLPKLRRFGLMLVGYQEDGDAIVEECLRTLVDTEIELDDGDGVTVGLFRLFLMCFRNRTDVSGNTSNSILGDEEVQIFVNSLTIEERIVFLLRHVEGFNPTATAAILQVAPEYVKEQELTILGKCNSDTESEPV